MAIYTICLVFGLMFTLASAFFGHLLGGHDAVGMDGQADAGSDSGGAGVSIFSPTVLSTFITAFGAFGMALSSISATHSVWVRVRLPACHFLAHYSLPSSSCGC